MERLRNGENKIFNAFIVCINSAIFSFSLLELLSLKLIPAYVANISFILLVNLGLATIFNNCSVS